MKNLSIITIICLFLISCIHNKESKSNNQDFFKSGTITITGQVNNLKTNNSNTIFLKHYNLLSGKSEVTSFKIDTSGKFEKILPVLNPQDISLEYQGRTIELLVNQSDSLNLVIDAQNQSQDVIISGIGGVRNTLFNQYLKLSFKARRDYYDNAPGKELDFILDYYSKTVAKLDSIIESIPDIKKDNLLASWVEADKKSLVNFDIIEDAYKNEVLPVTFLAKKNWITEKEINTIAFYCCRSYAIDILKVYNRCVIIENLKLHDDVQINLKNENYDKAIKLLRDSIYAYFPDILKDIKLYQQFQELLKPEAVKEFDKAPDIDLLKKYFLQNTNSEFVKILIINTNVEQPNVVLENSLINNSEDILGGLLQRFKGKVLYVDIIATWCGPCIAQLPYSAALHESINNDKVLFVYLFAKSRQLDWKKISAKYDIRGENILLSDEQYNFLLSKYNISTGFPQYLLIDTNGQITKNAKRPSSKGIQEEILKLLN